MQSVSVIELKSQLSSYLDAVQTGQEILIHDQQRPIARLMPIVADQNFDPELLALAAAGKARLPEVPLPESFWEMPAPEVSAEKSLASLRADRDED